MSMSKETRNLRARIRAAKIPRRSSTKLRLLTWNIRNLNGDKEDRAISHMAHIIRQFDVTAIQEVKDDLGGIEKLQKKLGRQYRFLFSDPSGNHERLVFCYNRRIIQFTGLAAEIVMAPGFGRAKKMPELEFDRTPYMASFRKNGCNFIIVTVHIFYGSGSAVQYRSKEIRNIAKYLKKRSTDIDALDSDFIACGDFNIEDTKRKIAHRENKRKISDKQKILKGLFDDLLSEELVVPEDIRNSPSNLTQTKHFDQIGFHTYEDSTIEFVKGGTIDFVDAIYQGDKKAKYKFTDHLPMWAVFSVKADKSPKYINP